MRINLTCVQCGKSFERDSWEVNRGKTKYCSLSCFYLSRIGQERPALRRRINKVCPSCGKEFETGGRAGKVSKIFCSNKCARLARFRRGAKCKVLSKANAAYIAGFLDGEGTIMIVLRKPSASYSLRVALAQSSKARQVLDWISEVTGVGASVNKNFSSPKHDMGLTWACAGDAAVGLLEQILPYLIVKRTQAELAINFQKRLSNAANKASRNWQKEVKDKMGLLNHRGNQSYELTVSSGG
jgi:hypothetical protein